MEGIHSNNFELFRLIREGTYLVRKDGDGSARMSNVAAISRGREINVLNALLDFALYAATL